MLLTGWLENIKIRILFLFKKINKENIFNLLSGFDN